MSDSESEETSLSSLGELLKAVVCPFLGPRDLVLFAVSSRAMRHIAMAAKLWNALTRRAFPSYPLFQSPNKCLPRHPANTFVLLWELHLQGETPARSWLFRDPVLRRIEEATRSRTRAQRAAKLREIEEEERSTLAPPPREPGSDEEDDEEDESD